MPSVVALARSPTHSFSKPTVDQVTVLEGLGIADDAHAGVTVQHRSRVAVNPDQPNLRQVHLIARELLDELKEDGFVVQAGDLGENILTEGIPLIELPADTLLHIGRDVVLRVTGLRNPCSQIEDFRPGLLKEVVYKDASGKLVRKTGVMSVVVAGGIVHTGDRIEVVMPAEPFRPLEKV